MARLYGVESFYFIFFFFLVFYVLILEKVYSKPEKKQYFYYAVFLLFFIMAGMRGITVGGDLKRYLPEYYEVINAPFGLLTYYGHHEIGYLIYIKILSLISPTDRSYLIGTSFASLIGPIYMFFKYSKKASVSVLVYYAMGYYTNTYNNVRQSIALSIIFIVLPFLINRDFKKYMIGVLVATSFHYSALVMLVVYPLYTQNISAKRLYIYAFSMLLGVVTFGYTLLGYVSEFIAKLDPDEFNEEAEGGGYGLFFFYLLIFVAISAFYVTKRRIMTGDQQKMMSMLVLFQIFAMAIQLTAPIFHSMVRATFYFFIPVATLAVPLVYSMTRSQLLKTAFYSLVFAFAIYYMIGVYSYKPEIDNNSQANIPYVFIDKNIFSY